MNITEGNWSVSNGVLIRITAPDPTFAGRSVVVAGVHRVGKFTRIAAGDPLENAYMLAAAPAMYRALGFAKRLNDEALPKFNWADSMLDAHALDLLNVTPGIIERAMMKARGEI